MLFSLIVSLIVAAILIQVAVFSTTIYLHRTATHKALELHPAVVFGFKFALWITTGLSTKEWVAVHRKHHAFTDEEGDPHSPAIEGFWKVQLGNVYYYIAKPRKRTCSSATRGTSKRDGGIARCSSAGCWASAWARCRCASSSRHSSASPASGGRFSPPALTPSCMCSCCHPPSTVSAIASATRTSTIPPPTSGSSRC